MAGAGAHVGEQLGGQDVKAQFPDRLGAAKFGNRIAQLGVVEIGTARAAPLHVEVALPRFSEMKR